MYIILPFVLALVAYYLNRLIRLNSIILYVFSLTLAGLTSFFPNSISSTLILNGTLGLSFYIVVMYTGALPKGSKIKKKLRGVRKEYSILGFIFILPHAYLHIYETIIDSTPIAIYGLLAFALMLPLFIISFNVFKKKMSILSWLKFQKWAYLVYLLLFFHLIMMSSSDNAIVYLVIFGSYSFFKLYNYIYVKNRFTKSLISTISIGFVAVLLSTESFVVENEIYNIIEYYTFTDGTYEGEANGYRGISTKVFVTIQDNIIANISLDSCGCTAIPNSGKYLDAAYEITNNIVELNDTSVDSISGSTTTSDAIKEAVIDALEFNVSKIKNWIDFNPVLFIYNTIKFYSVISPFDSK